VDRWGLPLEIVLERCKEENICIDILNFTKIALNKHWHKERLLIKIKEAYNDIYGETFSAIVITRLREYLK